MVKGVTSSGVNYQYQPIILIGAPRSGTKLVRDFIAEHPDVDKVPFDVDYIWRLGNEAVPYDEIPVDYLTPQKKQRILRMFESFRSGAPYLIEKSVSNTMRVPYVHAVFPDARFIHLVRDGLDVVESIYRQWLTPPDIHHILEKAKTFPLREAFGYALSHARNTFLRLVMPKKKRIGSWGIRYTGIDEDVANKDLLEVCAIQWANCVAMALSDLSIIPSEQVLTIHYEDFVLHPSNHLKMIAQFASIDPIPYSEKVKVETISQQNIGKGRRNLSPDQTALVLPLIQETMALLK
jgi:hypothetical protein